MPFRAKYPQSHALLQGLGQVTRWLQYLRTRGTLFTASVLPNLERELQRSTIQEKHQIRECFRKLNDMLASAETDDTLWNDPETLFQEVTKELRLCLLGPEVRHSPPQQLRACCLYQPIQSSYEPEHRLCKVVAFQDLKRFNLDLPTAYSRLPDKVLLSRLGSPNIRRVGQLRTKRVFNWVAKRDELDKELESEEKKKKSNHEEFTEQDRATRIRDVLGMIKQDGQDYLVLITFPEDIGIERLARSSFWEGVVAPYRPTAPGRIWNKTVDLADAPWIREGMDEACCCPTRFTRGYKVEGIIEQPREVNRQEVSVMLQSW